MRLKCLASVIAGQSPPSEEVDDLEEGMVPFLQGNAEFGREHPVPRFACESAAKHALRGDVLLSVRAPVGALNVADRGYAIGRGLVAIRAKRGMHPRYLWWVLQGLVDAIQALANGSTYEGVTAADIESVALPMWPLTNQQRITDVLDSETHRIDALIEKRRWMVALLLEREQAELLSRLSASEAHQSLKQCGVRVCTGPFGTQLAAEEYVEAGVPLVNPTHIRDGQIISEPGVAVPPSLAASRLARHQLRRGDIVMGRKGNVGRAALITEREEGWICGSDSIAIRTAGSKLSPEFLVTALHVSLFRQQLESRSSGATLTNVNESNLLALHVPVLTLPAQRSVASQCDQVRNRTRATVRIFTRQVTLLKERRQALITAAVTGELDVTTGAA